VQHGDGLRTTYEPVTTSVAAGAVVARGAVLGVLAAGHPGCPAACLHWGVRRDRTTYLDPLVLLAPPHVRLLPVPDPWPDGPVREAGGGVAGPVGTDRTGPVMPEGEPARAPPSAARR
jgi:murein DD-endopeptidase MepM/ murein hydrolase activator NlpD